MTDTVNSLEDLAALGTTEKVVEVVVREPQIDSLGRSYSTGKRKNAIARVWVKRGSGKITINGKDQEVYFARPVLRMVINQPGQVTNRTSEFDVIATVKGGGLSGQAGAIRHGIATALTLSLIHI